MSRRCYKGKPVSIQTITTHLASNLSEAGRPIFSSKQIQYCHRWVTYVCFRDPIFVSNLNRLRNIQPLFESRQTKQLCVQSYCVGFRYFWILGVIVRQIFFSCVLIRRLSIAYFIHCLDSTKRTHVYQIHLHKMFVLQTADTQCKFVVLEWENNVRDVTEFSSHSHSWFDESFSFRQKVKRWSNRGESAFHKLLEHKCRYFYLTWLMPYDGLMWTTVRPHMNNLYLGVGT